MPNFVCPICRAPWDVPAYRVGMADICPRCGNRAVPSVPNPLGVSQPTPELPTVAPFWRIKVAPAINAVVEVDEGAIAVAAEKQVRNSRVVAYLVAFTTVLVIIAAILFFVGGAPAGAPLIAGIVVSILLGIGLFSLYWSGRRHAYAEALGAERRRATKEYWGRNAWTGAPTLVGGVSVFFVVVAGIRGARIGNALAGGNGRFTDDQIALLIGLGALAFGAVLCFFFVRSLGFVRTFSIAHLILAIPCAAFGFVTAIEDWGKGPIKLDAVAVAVPKPPFAEGGFAEAEWDRLFAEKRSPAPAMILVGKDGHDAELRWYLADLLIYERQRDMTVNVLDDKSLQIVSRSLDLNSFAKEIGFTKRVFVDESRRLITVVCDASTQNCRAAMLRQKDAEIDALAWKWKKDEDARAWVGANKEVPLAHRALLVHVGSDDLRNEDERRTVLEQLKAAEGCRTVFAKKEIAAVFVPTEGFYFEAGVPALAKLLPNFEVESLDLDGRQAKVRWKPAEQPAAPAADAASTPETSGAVAP